jgi:hypothetical protein
MMSSMVESVKRDVARPLHVLKPLINKDLAEGEEAAKEAGMPLEEIKDNA